MTLEFTPSERSTIGIEWELALVDADSGDLRQVAATVLDAMTDEQGDLDANLRQELLLNTVEVVSEPRRTVREAADDLERAITRIRSVTDPLRVELMCAGTHPFARWDHQKVTDKKRYQTLIDRTQWWGRQMLIYGVHVHVGIEDRDKVLPIQRAMHCFFSHLQSLSASSPFWGGKDTGYASNRALMFQQLPTAGLGFQFNDWDELEHYVDDMLHTGVIDSWDEVRWDIRPAPHFGTLEMRVCDGITNITELRAIAALTHCLVEHFSTMIDEGRELPSLPPWFLQENKWRSARYGMDAIIITNAAGDERLVTDAIDDLVTDLAPVAARLGCADELADLKVTLRRGASYQRQRAVARRNAGAFDAVVGSLVKEMRAGRPL
ncbi:glutamate--cysteine ligase [Paraoerskovia marina]|uniref:Putative glutamate--cysteine ligase 2 n=1 Tax=Paraoerskovia marina TaxID=545619 RepID=A0A1H1V6C8_9CELL|nr:glutamate--cysteine ligase [Paraoerskovia marina]SDS80263.1 carboxylate-amine ligase [Paraoerskovia marina]